MDAAAVALYRSAPPNSLSLRCTVLCSAQASDGFSSSASRVPLGLRLSDCRRRSFRPVAISGPRALAKQLVQEKPAAASVAAPAAAPAGPRGHTRLDPLDPAWQIGTEKKVRLKAFYETAVVPALKSEFGYTNDLQIPRLEKVVINCGMGDASQSAKALESASRDLATVTGQKPVVTRSRKAIAGFKLRAGVPVGMATTLRGQVMYAYLDRLVNLALPRMRDFSGVSRGGFDGRGNYSMGLSEQTVFPEIKFDQIDKARGMDISIVTTANTDREAQRLLELIGLPFQEGMPKKEVVRAKGRGRGRGGGRGGGAGKKSAAKKKK
eukprot:TRINITY_DN50_c0_g1_i1.p1 TRINITY_DN50_c0_g1~~TRINITY_DN50_c0_g1_i1.p1  ORF type:complete len:323 (-),score=59.83 TRINITY_DN50_c0_g1_i1:325-1293(-)